MPQQSTDEIDDHLRLWPLWLRGQELGGENGQNTEFMTVFSHELRNSLCAIRYAVGILRMETSTRSAALKARTVIERQVAQMTSRRDLLTYPCHAAGSWPSGAGGSTSAASRLTPHRPSHSQCEAQASHEYHISRAPVWVQADPPD